ncbi:MAG TPA: hypothetical protein VN617_01195 [Rhodoferax sp.]|jgi:hypothetical protein|nr:hypothetical protein [Rhodoferax sp.]
MDFHHGKFVWFEHLSRGIPAIARLCVLVDPFSAAIAVMRPEPATR